MDSLDPLKISATSLSPCLAAEKEQCLMVPVSKRDGFLSTYRRQNFAFPDSIMYYIAMNPATPKVCQSMIKSCKYFFIKNPVIVISDAYWDGENWRDNYTNIINLTKICSKIWINGRFAVWTNANTESIVSNIIPKLYRFDANGFSIHNQVISFNDYAFLSSSAMKIELFDTIIKEENGNVSALEKLVKTAAKVKRFRFSTRNTLTNVNSKTAKELFENPDFSRLEYFNLDHIPETFDIEAFYEYMKKNKTTNIYLDFDAPIIDAYKARLGAIVDEILGTETLDYKPPLIYFDGIDYEKFDKFDSIFCRRGFIYV